MSRSRVRYMRAYSKMLRGFTAIQRRMVMYSFISTGTCMAGLLCLHLGHLNGVFQSDAIFALTLSGLISSSLYYAAVFTGYSLRFKDPTLVEPTTMVIVAHLAWAYAIAGAGRAASLPILFTVTLFCLFTCTPVQLRRIGFFVCMTFAFASGYRLLHGATHQEVITDAAVFFLLLLNTASFTFLSSRLALLRDQKENRSIKLMGDLKTVGEMARRDPLTGLFNRRHVLDHVETMQVLTPGSGSMTVCLVDLDRFKSINDSHGHSFGDLVLQITAHHLTQRFAGLATVGRWGGEEFIIVTNQSSAALCAQVLSEVMGGLKECPIETPSGSKLTISFSAGIVTKSLSESFAQALGRADEALYSAKGGGRSMIVTA